MDSRFPLLAKEQDWMYQIVSKLNTTTTNNCKHAALVFLLRALNKPPIIYRVELTQQWSFKRNSDSSFLMRPKSFRKEQTRVAAVEREGVTTFLQTVVINTDHKIVVIQLALISRRTHIFPTRQFSVLDQHHNH